MAGENDELDGVTEDEAKQLLDGAPKTTDPAPSESATDDKDWKAEAERWKKLSRQNEKAANERAERLKQFEDANKSESQRLQEERDSHLTRAQKAEAALKRREIAEQIAPDHATAKQIAQVAKRMSGDDEDALEADARELFDWIAPEPAEPKPGSKTPQRPQPRLKGGSAEPDEDPEENDPRKLAALLPRRR